MHRIPSTFELNWWRAPAYTTVLGILQGLAASAVEKVFRLHAQILNDCAAFQGMRVVAFDGKTLRGSFDKFTDTLAARGSMPPLVSAFAADSALVLGHLEIDDKSNEIPAVQRLARRTRAGQQRGHRGCAALSKKTFERAAERSLRLIAQVKANQPTHFGDRATAMRRASSRSTAMRPSTPRGRDTRRATSRSSMRAPISATPNGHPLSPPSFGCPPPPRRCDTATGLWNLASETSYHVSNAVFSAHAAGGAIRAHWGIENRHHYPRDVDGRGRLSRPQKPRHSRSHPQFRRQHHARQQRRT